MPSHSLQMALILSMPERFSLEKDYFEPLAAAGALAGFRSDGYFIDIGIPEDYARAQRDFASGAWRPYPFDALRFKCCHRLGSDFHFTKTKRSIG